MIEVFSLLSVYFSDLFWPFNIRFIIFTIITVMIGIVNKHMQMIIAIIHNIQSNWSNGSDSRRQTWIGKHLGRQTNDREMFSDTEATGGFQTVKPSCYPACVPGKTWGNNRTYSWEIDEDVLFLRS